MSKDNDKSSLLREGLLIPGGMILEIDVTEKVKKYLKYGPAAIIILAILCAGGIYAYQHSRSGVTVYDARIASTVVHTKARADGSITELLVNDGDHVEAGDVIAHIDVKVTEDQIAQLQQNVDLAQKNLEQIKQGRRSVMPGAAPSAPSTRTVTVENGASSARAQARLARMNELYSMGAISRKELDAAAADAAAASTPTTQTITVPAPSAAPQIVSQAPDPEMLKQAEAAVKQAQAALENAKADAQATEIVAPVSGTVYYADGIEEGTDIKAGQTIVDIGDASNAWVEARVSQNQKEKLRLGQFVTYTVEGKSYQGTVTDIIDPNEAAADDDASASSSSPDASEDSSTEAQQTAEEPSSEKASTATEGTEEDAGNADSGDDRLLVKISLPKELANQVRPGTETIVKFNFNH
jgi:multidrug resistance efflux pump